MHTKKQISSLVERLPLLRISSYTKLKVSLLITIFAFNSLAQTPQWQFMGLAGEEIYDIAVDDSGNVYVASWTGIFKSTDDGASWEFKNNGLQIGDVYKLFIDYAGNIYLCGSANFPGFGLYKSTDGGENWVGFADTLNGGPINNFEDVTVIPNEPGGFIYVSNYYGVYRSTDNGITWQSTNYTDPCARFIGINNNGYMFFGNLCASWFGIYRSTDLGSNWERHTLLGIDAMIYLKDGSVLASAYDPGLGSCGVYKTIDNGANWVNTNTFSNLSCPIDFVLDTNDDIYAAVGYVFISSNNGISWSNYGLPGQGAFKLAIDSSGYIWSGNHLDGVYKTPGRTIPVELVSFAAELNNNNVLLSWVTASEINNQGFQIERRETKNEEWINIGFVNGKVTTTEPQAYTFVDKNLETGKYQYRLKQIDFDGSFEYSKTVEIEIQLPDKFKLNQNYPNPFNPKTKIEFQLPQSTNVKLTVFNILGEKVTEILNEELDAGFYSFDFDGKYHSSGTYIYYLQSDYYNAIRKMILLK